MKTRIGMMLALALAVAALSGCSKPEEGEGDAVAKVRALTEKICAFLPTASSVAAMLAANNPAVSGVTAIANAICEAVSRKSMAPDAACPMVNGVCVEGDFKKRE